MDLDRDSKRRELERKELGGLLVAAKYEDVETIKLLAKEDNFDVSMHYQYSTPKSSNQAKNSKSLIDDLINDDNERVERLMRRCEDGYNIFHYAAKWKFENESSMEVLHLLLGHSTYTAEVINKQNSSGGTPLDMAISAPSPYRDDLIDVLRGKGAKTKLELMHPLHGAAEYEDIDTIKLLLDNAQASVADLDVYGQNALHYAAGSSNASVKCLEFLLDHHTCSMVDINKRCQSGYTPLDKAKGNMNPLRAESDGFVER